MAVRLEYDAHKATGCLVSRNVAEDLEILRVVGHVEDPVGDGFLFLLLLSDNRDGGGENHIRGKQEKKAKKRDTMHECEGKSKKVVSGLPN